MTTPRNERGARVLAEYAGTYYPGAENTEDPDEAYTVATDIIADARTCSPPCPRGRAAER